MFRLDDALVTSASDLTLASRCEFALLRQLDLRLGRVDGVPVADDPMLRRAGRLGDDHEARIADEYRRAHPGPRGVVEIETERPLTRAGLRAAARATEEAFAAGASVVYQATFFDESDPSAPFVGFADFIVRRPDGSYRVQDTKLARSPKVTALLQLAAYHEQLERIGVPVDDEVELILGDGRSSVHPVSEIVPVFRNRRARLAAIIAEHLAESGPVLWGDERYAVDGRCEHCEPEVQAARDLLLVAGMRVAQRTKLMAAGIRTLDELAAAPVKPAGCALPDAGYAVLQAQAELQAAVVPSDDPHAPPPYRLHDPGALAALPPPDAGDLFFDFEGDPLYRAPGADGGTREALWGLDYLFGVVDVDEAFTTFWAHDLAEEKAALVDFLDFVQLRRAAHPGLHIYHYAPYERTHLLSIAARHGVGEHVVDELLRDGVLVDLYPLVKKSLRIGGRSYSIKKLEPLYMGDEHRAADGVANGADSVEEYARSRELELAGRHEEAQRLLDGIGDYNRYDCVSTLRLRDWLLARAAERGVRPAGGADGEELDRLPFEPSPLNLELLRLAELAAERADDSSRGAYELGAAAIDYHRREAKSFWWEHFARLVDPVESWGDGRGVLLVERAEVVADWDMTGRQRRMRRTLRLHGTWAPGSAAPRGDAFVLYRDPGPFSKPGRRRGSLVDLAVRMTPDDEVEGGVLVDEVCPADAVPWSELPLAVTPGPPPRADSLVAAIEEWAAAVVAAAPHWPRDAASDVLRRAAPAAAGPLEPMTGPDDGVRAVVASALRLDGSYLAVQGPPGTGKTYLASRVIAELVREHRWRIGVVAQSHKVVENVLDQVVAAGLPAHLVGKAAPSEHAGTGYYDDARFVELPGNGQAAFARENAGAGYVLGGTAWDLTNLRRVDRGQLDLLVIDEAGQFSLAATIAVGVSARRLLLLGDPQQLPQVSQGTHPAPVDASALGHLSEGHDVLPPELGYFLARSRRMDARVTAPVSRLSYEGELRAHPATAQRMLVGVEPGLHPIRVSHRHNATSSVEEAAEVVRLVSASLGRLWTDPGADRVATPLGPRDVIVVTPYNAQVETIRAALDAAGHPAVRVGTVDRFQGQEAVISIVSMAASSPDEVPRGLSFLLSRNRLNVAISRAQWAAYLISSPALVEHLPATAEGVAELSRFLGLTD